jgi:hypothetical protein
MPRLVAMLTRALVIVMMMMMVLQMLVMIVEIVVAVPLIPPADAPVIPLFRKFHSHHQLQLRIQLQVQHHRLQYYAAQMLEIMPFLA